MTAAEVYSRPSNPCCRTVWALTVTCQRRCRVAAARTRPPVSTCSRTVKPAAEVRKPVAALVPGAGCSDHSSPAASAT